MRCCSGCSCSCDRIQNLSTVAWLTFKVAIEIGFFIVIAKGCYSGARSADSYERGGSSFLFYTLYWVYGNLMRNLKDLVVELRSAIFESFFWIDEIAQGDSQWVILHNCMHVCNIYIY